MSAIESLTAIIVRIFSQSCRSATACEAVPVKVPRAGTMNVHVARGTRTRSLLPAGGAFVLAIDLTGPDMKTNTSSYMPLLAVWTQWPPPVGIMVGLLTNLARESLEREGESLHPFSQQWPMRTNLF